MIVTSHHLDKTEGVYRLTVGEPIEATRPMTDEEGQIILDDDGQPLTETYIAEYANVEDFVFAADDEQWSGKSPEEVAASQRELVKEALQRRDEERQRQLKETLRQEQAGKAHLPGSGEPL